MRLRPMAQAAAPSPATILIVENEALVRAEMAHVIRLAGLTVLEAGDADEAISLLDAHREIEVLVTDILMPGSMDGLRLAHHVRDRRPPIRLIVASGRLEIQSCELPRDSIFIAKPFGQEALEDAVMRMAGRDYARDTGHLAA